MLWNLSPPRIRIEVAALEIAHRADTDLVLELDGSTHDTADARDRDADRDLDDLAQGQVIPRLRYRQVFGTPCRTALRLEALLRLRGWESAGHPCDRDVCDFWGRSS